MNCRPAIASVEDFTCRSEHPTALPPRASLTRRNNESSAFGSSVHGEFALDVCSGLERAIMRLLRKIWVSKATAFPRRLVVGAKSQVKKRYQQLKNRYGPRYTRAMLFITFLGFFSPIPRSE